MKIRYIASALLLTVALGGMAKSAKRGVSENQFSLVSMMEALEPGVGWYYTWGGSPGKGYDGIDEYDGLEFVPMCWNASYNADAIREWCKGHPETKYLLGFNEPNFTAQANMSPADAAKAWPGVQALAAELGLQLVAPALNYSPNPPYTDPLKWMDEFIGLVGKDAFDFLAIHNYGGLGVMKTLATAFHDRYGKDVWVTEFCLWPNEGDPNSTVTPESQIMSMVETLEWLETTEWIFRYAWFKPVGNYNASKGPNYGLVRQTGAYLDPWALSPQGNVYVYMSEFNRDLWHPVGEWIPATDYIASSNINLGESANPASSSPIEIISFTSGAEVTWQFDVKDAGDHLITLSLSGYGEPSRFDPKLQWVIEEGGNEKALESTFSPSLPNSDTEYSTHTSTVSIPSGHVRLKLKDMAPYQPSGIRISSVRLDNVAGVKAEPIDTENFTGSIYNLQGMCVGRGADSWHKLPSGIYIVDGKKVAKSM